MAGSIDNYYNSEEFKTNLNLYETSKREGKSCILGSEELADIAEYYFEKGKLADAKETAEYAASLYPDATAPKIVLAKYYIMVKKDKEKAKECIEKITECNDLNYALLIAEYYIFTEKKEKAIMALDKALTYLEDEDLLDLPAEACNLLLDYGMTKQAKHYLELDRDKSSNDYLRMKARMAFAERKYEEGAEIMERLIDKDPFNTGLWKILAIEQNNFDKYSNAATSIEYALAIDDKDAEAYMILGNAFFKMCNYLKALEAYRKSAEITDSEQSDMMMARCYFCMQDMDKTLAYLKSAETKCTEETANKIDICRDFAITYGWMGNNELAFKYLEKLKEYGKLDAETYLVEGSILLGMNRFEDANIAFYNGYKLTNNPTEYTFQIAVSLYEHSMDQYAYMFLKRVFEKDPERTRGLAYLAACSNYLGMGDEFIGYLKDAVDKNPEEAKAVLADFFPKGMEPYDYVEYAKKHSRGINEETDKNDNDSQK